MNANCYKIIFSKRLGTLVAVGEHTSSTGKAASGQGCRGSVVADGFVGALRFTFASVALACLSLGNTQAQSSPIASTALPQGSSVSTGSATISTQGAAMAITQTTDKASINWQSFNVGTGASVNIAQPSSDAVLLNRVVGNDPSQILGQLKANGQVILLNPNGVLFGKDGSVTASAFTASTFGLSDADFMAGYYKYNRNGSTATVVNHGTIETSAGGFVALIGATVTNEGTIHAPQGDVVMAAAESVTLPEELVKPQPVTMPNTVSVRMSKRVRLELDPAAINTAVNNTESGVIVTEGGQVLLQAAAISSAVASVTHSGRIDTSAPQAGAVTVLADNGVIKVDGSIKANSNGTGSQGQTPAGGDIVIGNDVATSVLAKATDVSGAKLESQGGFVETSGEHLIVDGIQVKAKNWLLDPTDITITTTDSGIGSSGVNPITKSPNTSGTTASTVNATTLATALGNGTSVLIKTTNASGSGNGDITVASNVSVTNSNGDATLTLQAERNITVNGNVKIERTGSNKLNVILNSDSDGTAGGVITMSNGSQIISNGGNITLGGGTAGDGSGYALGTSSHGVSLSGTTLNAGTGNVSVKGQSSSGSGVNFFNDNTITAATYDIRGQSSTNVGVHINNGGNTGPNWYFTTNFTSTSGNSVIEGASTSDRGLFIYASNVVNINSGAGTAAMRSADGEMRIGYSGGVTINTNGNITLGSKLSSRSNYFQQGLINAQSGTLTILGKSATGSAVAMQEGSGIGARIVGTNGTQITLDGESSSGIGVNLQPAGLVNNITASGTGASIAITGLSNSNTGIFLGSSSITGTDGTVTLTGTSNSSSGLGINHGYGAIAAKNGLTMTGTAVGNDGITSYGALSSSAGNISLSGTTSTATGVTLNANLTAAGNINIQGTRASAGTGVYIVSTSTLTSSGVGASISASSNYNVVHSGAITNQVSGGTAATISLSSSLGSVSGAGSLASSGVSASGGGITIDTATAGTLSGVISGTGSLTKIGAGTTTLSNYQTYSGATNINAGTLSFTTPLTSYATATTISNQYRSTQFNTAAGATLNFNVPTNATVNNGESSTTTFNGAGTLSKTGGGKLQWLIWDNTFNMSSGSLIDIQAGTFLASSSYHGKWATNGSSLNIAAGATFDASEADVRVDALTGAGSLKMGWSHLGGITTGVNNMTAGTYNTAGSATFSGVISANASVSTGSKFATTGTGTQILTGTNTYVGTTTVGAGSTLQIGNGGATGTLGSGAIVDNGTLVLNRDNSADITLSQAISGTGALTKAGTSKTILTGANTYTGTTTISAGTLQVGNGGATGTLGSGGVVNNTALIFNRNASADLSVAGAISGSGTLTQAGAGKTILTSDNTYTGATTISGGTLQIGNGGATGNLGSTSGVTLSNNANLTFNKNANTTIDKAISGNGNVTATITGDLALTSDIALTGTNTINLTASGDITETSGSLTATNLYMTATSGDIGSTSNRIRSNVSNLSLNTAGSAFVTEANSVSVAATVGDLDLATTNGTLTVSAVNSITGITATGDVALTGSTTTDTGMYIGQNITATGDVTLTGSTSSNADSVAGIKSAMTVSAQNITMLASATGTGGALGYFGAGGIFTASQQLNLTGTTGGTANGFYSFTGGFTSGTGMAISGTSASGQGVGLDNGITLTNGSSGGISITGTATDATKQAIGLRGTVITNGGGNTSLTATTGAIFTSGGNPSAWGGVARTNTIANSGTGAVQITAGNGSTTNSGSIDGSVLAITQNGNGGVVVRTSGTGNLTAPKVINAGTGDVVVAAGSAIAAGTGTGGQVLSVANNTVTQNSTGKTYIYTGSASGTADMGIISPAFDTLYYNGTNYTHNAAFNTAYGSTIAGGADAQVLFRETAAPAFTLALPTVALNKIYGQSDPTLANVRSAVQTAYTAASGATTLTTDVAGVGGSNTFGLDASEAIAAITRTRVTGESVNAGTPYVYSLSASALNTAGSGTGVTLTIDKAALTAVLTGTAIKQYDGLTNATLTNANYSVTGWVSTEGASVGQTLGAYTNPNVVNNTTLSKGVVSATLNNANFTANAGTDLNNYTLPTSATGNIGVITAAPLTIQVNNTFAFVTQDANTATDQGFSYTGFKNGESAATALSGSFTRTYTGANTPSAGTYTGVYDISATPTATNGNYAITVQKGNLVVVPADKLLITIDSQSDTYGNRTSTNGGSASTVTAEYCFDHSVACSGANIASLSMTQLSGNQWKAADNTGSFVVFDTSLINANYSTGGFLKTGNYTYAASEIVPLSLPNGNFTGRATNGGVLTVGTLAVSPNTSNISKTYDGSSSLAGAALAATGALAGDDVAITPSTGAFASVNAGSGIAYTLGGLSLSGADMGNYSLAANSASGTGTITAKQLSWSGTTVANKIFDGNTTATVTSNGTLSGLVGTETLNLTQVAATFDTAAVGTSKTVALSASLQNGTNGGLASNYTLGATSTTADITAASNGGGKQPIVHPPKPIIPTDSASESGGGSNSGGSSGGNPYLVIPSNRANSADRCTPNTLEDCLCETQEPKPVEGLAICYQPKKTAGTRSNSKAKQS